MARINVYLPDELARRARAARMSVSSVTQAALRRELGASTTADWLKRVARLRGTKVRHQDVISALDAERDLHQPRG